MKNKIIYKALIILLLLSTLMPIATAYAQNSQNNNSEIQNNTKQNSELKNTEGIEIYSEAGLLFEPKTKKILYNKNAKEKKYPASTTKILTAIITIENCNLDDKVVVDYDSIMSVPAGYTVAALQVDEELTVKQLLEVLLVHSANDAANVLGKHVAGSIESFASMMNSKASEIGCENSHFLNPSGKHENDHYSTAYDLALIMDYCMKNETFKEIISSKSCIIPETNKYAQRVFTNSNELLIVDTREISSNYYYPYAIAGKTGYTAEAKNCLVSVAQKDDLELICVVLGGLKTEKGLSARFVDTKHLFEYGYSNYTIKTVKEKGSIANQVEIQNATSDTKNLNLLLDDDINVFINQKNVNSKIEPKITITEDLVAPIAQNKVLGEIEYNVEDVKYTAKLVAEKTVEKDNSLFFTFLIILIITILMLIFKLSSRNKKPKHGRAHSIKYIN